MPRRLGFEFGEAMRLESNELDPMPKIELEIEFHLDSLQEQMRPALIERMEQAARWVADRFHKETLTASISIVDDPTIQRLNRQHLQHDWPTDVLSFAFQSDTKVNGEVIASWDTALRMSEVAGWSSSDELILYVVHGLLHLVGMDDQQPIDRALMRSVELEYLQLAGFPNSGEYLNRFEDVCY